MRPMRSGARARPWPAAGRPIRRRSRWDLWRGNGQAAPWLPPASGCGRLDPPQRNGRALRNLEELVRAGVDVAVDRVEHEGPQRLGAFPYGHVGVHGRVARPVQRHGALAGVVLQPPDEAGHSVGQRVHPRQVAVEIRHARIVPPAPDAPDVDLSDVPHAASAVLASHGCSQSRSAQGHLSSRPVPSAGAALDRLLGPGSSSRREARFTPTRALTPTRPSHRFRPTLAGEIGGRENPPEPKAQPPRKRSGKRTATS
jgi:hypothetical protein